MKYFFVSLFILCSIVNIYAKREVTFFSEDGLEITADLYFVSKEFPYVLLFHQDGYSRGEYNDIAEKILNLNYNCLAVDLRVGEEVNYIENETAKAARLNNYPNDFLDSEQDIIAAIEYAYTRSDTSVILFGSSYSAALCLKVSINNPKVHAVIAFGTGEYFEEEFSLKGQINKLKKPVFVATNDAEYSFVSEIFESATSEYITIFKPHDGKGAHGSKALWETSINNKEYWLALLMFFSKL